MFSRIVAWFRNSAPGCAASVCFAAVVVRNRDRPYQRAGSQLSRH
ncbi:hypothetical protein ANMWB30_18820 [Arthrobacter sp. MWB30]|nr:hypothetical protein ANMWB30_18820 [Arthrobacter sp. MWB30]